MTRYITLEEALVLCRTLGELKVRDLGLLDSALHRPQTAFAGQEAYPLIEAKAAALLHSLAKNHPLFDGNKRLAWMATDVFLRRNGFRSELENDEIVRLVLHVASGEEGTVDGIAERLRVRRMTNTS